jgi:hypothetical protein
MDNKLEKSNRFHDLGTPARVVIYVVNGLLLCVLLGSSIFAAMIGFMAFFYALGSIGRGGGTALIVMFLIACWFIASFACFVGVIVITAWKQRWNWVLQFLPLAAAVIFYSSLIIANRWSNMAN